MKRAVFSVAATGLACVFLCVTPKAGQPNPHRAPTALIGFIDFTARGTQPGLTFPLLGSSSCGTCHAPQIE